MRILPTLYSSGFFLTRASIRDAAAVTTPMCWSFKRWTIREVHSPGQKWLDEYDWNNKLHGNEAQISCHDMFECSTLLEVWCKSDFSWKRVTERTRRDELCQAPTGSLSFEKYLEKPNGQLIAWLCYIPQSTYKLHALHTECNIYFFSFCYRLEWLRGRSWKAWAGTVPPTASPRPMCPWISYQWHWWYGQQLKTKILNFKYAFLLQANVASMYTPCLYY